MNSIILTAAVGVFAAIAGAVGVIIAARYGFIGKLVEARPQEMSELYERIGKLEDDNQRCNEKLETERQRRRDEVFDLKQVVSFALMVVDYVLRKYPEAEPQVQEMRDRIEERQAQWQREARERQLTLSGEALHITREPPK